MNIWKLIENNRVYRSIFRNGPPANPKESAEVISNNLFLHIHSSKVHKNVLRFPYTLGLGLISLYLFVILIVTGILLMFYYVPSTKEAYGNIKDLEFAVTFGEPLRAAHRWAAHLMVAFVFLHMCRVFYTGSYKNPREFNWVVGVILLLLTLFLSFTGYLLPWDQLAFWAITVGTNIAGYAPVIGDATKMMLLGGNFVGQQALLRFYVLHVMVLPAFLLMLLGVHFWRIRKDGGLSRPPDEATSPFDLQVIDDKKPPRELFPTKKTYGLMAMVKKSDVHSSESGPENTVPVWPHLLIRELLLFLIVVAAIWILALVFPAPLEEPANSSIPTNPAKAPWYFLGLQELVSYSALLGGVVIPGLMVAALMVLPYFDRNPAGIGLWLHKSRRIGIAIFTLVVLANIVLIIIGTYFRGPNWAFFLPWEMPSGGGH